MHFRQKERKRERKRESLRHVYEKLPRFVFVRNIRELPRIINRFALLWISSANNINVVAKKCIKHESAVRKRKSYPRLIREESSPTALSVINNIIVL